MKALSKSLVIGALLISQSVFSQQRGDTFAQAKQNKTANLVYVHAGVNGFAALGENGKPTGLLVDLMESFEKYVADKYGISITSTYVAAPDKDFKLYLDEVMNASGGVFGLSNTSIKEERKKIFEFSPAFLNNISVLISNNSFSNLSSLDQINSTFAGKTAYGVPGTTNYTRLRDVKRNYFPDMLINSVNSSKEIVENVYNNADGFGFVDIHYYLEYLNQGKSIKRHPVGDKPGDKFGIIMPKGSDWDPVITEFLNSGVMESADYRQMVSNNLGKGALRMLN